MRGEIKHKHKNDKEKLKVDEEIQSIEEELKPLTLINPQIKRISGLKGVHIVESQKISNIFQWETHNVFEIYAADANGNRLDQTSEPILYGAGKSHSQCTACDIQGIYEIAITTKMHDSGSDEPYIYINKQSNCWSASKQQIFINQNGNQRLVADVSRDIWNDYCVESQYINKLMMSTSVFRCYCTNKNYSITDNDGNKGIFVQHKNFCSCSSPNEYSLGFPPKYNEDQNTILLSLCVYKAFSNYKKRSSNR